MVLHVGALASPPGSSLLLRHAGGTGIRRPLVADIPIALPGRCRAARAIVHRRLAGPASEQESCEMDRLHASGKAWRRRRPPSVPLALESVRSTKLRRCRRGAAHPGSTVTDAPPARAQMRPDPGLQWLPQQRQRQPRGALGARKRDGHAATRGAIRTAIAVPRMSKLALPTTLEDHKQQPKCRDADTRPHVHTRVGNRCTFCTLTAANRARQQQSRYHAHIPVLPSTCALADGLAQKGCPMPRRVSGQQCISARYCGNTSHV